MQNKLLGPSRIPGAEEWSGWDRHHVPCVVWLGPPSRACVAGWDRQHARALCGMARPYICYLELNHKSQANFDFVLTLTNFQYSAFLNYAP